MVGPNSAHLDDNSPEISPVETAGDSGKVQIPSAFLVGGAASPG